MKKRKRTYNVRLIKATWPYSVQEIAAKFHIHKGAILRWIKEGLHADKIGGEYLIRGNELIRFMSERQKKKKRKCTANEFFCFKCRAARLAYMSIVDIVIISPSRFLLKGLCAECNTPINKAQGIEKLQRIQECFYIQKTEGRHIIERSDHIVNSNLETQI